MSNMNRPVSLRHLRPLTLAWYHALCLRSVLDDLVEAGPRGCHLPGSYLDSSDENQADGWTDLRGVAWLAGTLESNLDTMVPQAVRDHVRELRDLPCILDHPEAPPLHRIQAASRRFLAARARRQAEAIH